MEIRITVVDDAGAVSFVAPAHILKMLTAACAQGTADHRTLLNAASAYDADALTPILNGLWVFDEHNGASSVKEFILRAGWAPATEVPPFRVVDEDTRRRSLEGVGAGLVVFNLPARRIVQIQNAYNNLRRRDRGRIWRDGRPTRALYRYELPPEWRIVP
ncbi:MAG: hypothetical protein AVDCRST_MAG73-606 [uncultured Thermomicrobiales bacterium]|uniref:Uncharacterized protein n=1 Tax=uncultured Thermomicrobiales bacterium TaxID=1645740 RepID=A0A6J4TNG2_9BACT|nr:MAG: hypothetical protein AVDCRST_MAG73-606 [uncultured Thermomicrobiales bacterium]